MQEGVGLTRQLRIYSMEGETRRDQIPAYMHDWVEIEQVTNGV